MQGKCGGRTLFGTLSLLPLVVLTLSFSFVPSLGLLFGLSLGLSFALSLGLSLGPHLAVTRPSLDRGVVPRRHRGVPALYPNRHGSCGASGVCSNRRPLFPVTRNTISAAVTKSESREKTTIVTLITGVPKNRPTDTEIVTKKVWLNLIMTVSFLRSGRGGGYS